MGICKSKHEHVVTTHLTVDIPNSLTPRITIIDPPYQSEEAQIQRNIRFTFTKEYEKYKNNH